METKESSSSEVSTIKKKHKPILMEVTRRPQALRTTPMLLAVTPFPKPLTTPPVTTTYFILSTFSFCQLLTTRLAAGICWVAARLNVRDGTQKAYLVNIHILFYRETQHWELTPYSSNPPVHCTITYFFLYYFPFSPLQVCTDLILH